MSRATLEYEKEKRKKERKRKRLQKLKELVKHYWFIKVYLIDFLSKEISKKVHISVINIYSYIIFL